MSQSDSEGLSSRCHLSQTSQPNKATTLKINLFPLDIPLLFPYNLSFKIGCYEIQTQNNTNQTENASKIRSLIFQLEASFSHKTSN